MSMIQVNVPDIGDFDEVAVIELLVAVGDTVAKDQSLITVESDKASMEIPSSDAGVVKAIHVKLGDKVKLGSLMLELEGAADAPPVAAATRQLPHQRHHHHPRQHRQRLSLPLPQPVMWRCMSPILATLKTLP